MTRDTTVDPALLDLVMREEDFAIYYDGNILTTPGGAEFSHANSRLLKHLLTKFTLTAPHPMLALTSVYAFTFYKDYLLCGQDFVLMHFNSLIAADALIAAKTGKKKPAAANPEAMLNFVDQNQAVFNMVFWSNSVIMEAIRNFIIPLKANDRHDMTESSHFRDFLGGVYAKLSHAEKTIVNLLAFGHRSGLLLPLMLVSGKISPSEYANGALTVHSSYLNAGEEMIYPEAGLELPDFPATVDWEKPIAFIKKIHSEALRLLEFGEFFQGDEKRLSVMGELIHRGESERVEFKSTLRWDLRQQKKNPAIEHASLKTIAAFVNSEGGDLLIGVADDGNITGIEKDGFANDDKFLLHLWALIKSSMGQQMSPFLKTTLEKMGGLTVCRVSCQPGNEPVFLRQKGFDESFYVRSGPSTASLEISEALRYIATRFNK